MEKIVFTNGCFDILHPGHVNLLERAKNLGTKLIVGINSDRSVKAIKGNARPIINENDRKLMLESLRVVDEVIIFDEQTPEKLIREIKPDVLVKGGDWQINEIIGGGFVTGNGGEVFSLPLVEGYSTTKIIETAQPKITNSIEPAENNIFEKTLAEHLRVFARLSRSKKCVEDCANLIVETFVGGGKILICGNGGSAADAQHIAAEFVGRYETERRALPAIALTTDTSALTALANDYDFEKIFSRQVEALAVAGDCLIAISTSGNSPNVLAAVMKARSLGCKIIGMTGENGKKLSSLSDECLMIPSPRTARIQEAHITAAHIWCEMVDAYFSDKSSSVNN